MGQSDLTQAGAYGFGENVFSTAVQRQRLPKAAYKSCRRRWTAASRSSPSSPTPSPPP